LQHLGPVDRAARHIWMTRGTEIVRKGQSSPSGERILIMALDLQEPAACQGASFRPAKALEQRHAAVAMRASGGLSADQDQL